MVNREQAFEAVGVLVGSTPGPWSDDVVEVWVKAFMDLGEPEPLLAACRGVSMHHDSGYRPNLSAVIDRYNETVQWRRRSALPDGMVHCDGSGWVPSGVGMRPCPRCSPALSAVFRDPDEYEQWAKGVGLHRLGVGVELVRGQMRWVGSPPPRCHVAVDDGPVLVLDPRRGMALAHAAYVEERSAQGRQPSEQFFRAMFNAVSS